MKRLDLHVHSRRSPDAKGSIMELALTAQEKGLHGFAITDHDACNDPDEIRAAAEATGMIIVSGCEASTLEGHLLCFGITEPPSKGCSVEEAVAQVDAQGGVCVPAHPLKVLSGMGPTQLQAHWSAGRIVAAEGVNGRERRIVQDNTLHLLREHRIPSTGGTDAHWVREIGTAWTWFPDTVSDADDVVAALKRGDVQGDGGTIQRRKVWGHGVTVPVRKLRSRRNKD